MNLKSEPTAGRLRLFPNSLRKFVLICGAMAAGSHVASSQTYFDLATGSYTQDFADIATWSSPSTGSFGGVAVGGATTVPEATKITAASTAFQTNASSGGIHKGTENIQFLSTGTTNNSTSVALDLFLKSTGTEVGTLGFDAATVFNGSGDRQGTLRVYATTNDVDWVEVTGTNLPYVATNNVAGSATVSANLPSGLDDKATIRLRFYYHNGPAGTSGSRPKISVDNLTVTSGATGLPDTTPPSLAASNPLSPANGATDVPLATTLVAKFSEAVVGITGGTIELRKVTGDELVETFDVESPFSVDVNGTTVTIYPSANLLAGTAYYVKILPATLEDTAPAGNDFPGFTTSDVWSFTTVPPDTTGPVATVLTPTANSAEGPVVGPLTAKALFDEVVLLSTTPTVGSVRLYKDNEVTDDLLETLDPDEITVTGFSDTGTFAFDTTLTPGATYRIEVDANVFVDQLGNPNAAFSWTFSAFDISQMKVAVNKYFNSGGANGADDVVELLVVANGVGTTWDLTGMILKDYSGSNASDGGGAYTFAADPRWAAVKAGTLIVLTNNATASEEFDDTDFVIHANLKNTDLFTAGSASGTGTFDISGTDLLQIKAAGSPLAGGTGAMHTLAAGATTTTWYSAAPMPKTNSGSSGGSMYVINATGSANDFNLTSGAGNETKTFGLANTAGNGIFIDSLRGTSSVSVSVATLSRVLSETAGVQTDAITVSVGLSAPGDRTITLSSSPSGLLSMPASVVLPGGATSVSFSFTPVSDDIIAGNRVATVTASLAGNQDGTAQITLVEAQYANPPVVINKYQNGSPDKIELLVIQDGANLSGMIIKDFSGEMGGDGGGKFMFTDAALWQYLPSGTLVVLSNNSDPEEEDFDPSDFVVKVRLRNSTYFDSTSPGLSSGLDIANVEMVMLKAAGSSPAGLAGNIHALAGGRTFANPDVAGSYYYETPAPKVLALAGGAGVYVENTNSNLGDFNGTDATGAASPFPTFGLPNNATNETYINSLRAAAAPMAPIIVSALTADGTVGEAFSYTISATASPTSYNATGLPSGLTVGTATGIISGTPTVDGTFNVTISATNGVGSDSETLVITIFAAPAGGYSTWADTYAGGQGAGLDFDNDGVKNGVEYFFGVTTPGFTANPPIVTNAGVRTVTWPYDSVGAADATFVVQHSSTLASNGWTDVPVGELTVVPGNPGTITYTFPATAGPHFARILVTTP